MWYKGKVMSLEDLVLGATDKVPLSVPPHALFTAPTATR
jgi:hypothetical protein